MSRWDIEEPFDVDAPPTRDMNSPIRRREMKRRVRRSGYVRDILDRVRSSEVQTLPLFEEKSSDAVSDT